MWFWPIKEKNNSYWRLNCTKWHHCSIQVEYFQLDYKAQILYRNVMWICLCVSIRISDLDYSKVVKKVWKYYRKVCLCFEKTVFIWKLKTWTFLLILHSLMVEFNYISCVPLDYWVDCLLTERQVQKGKCWTGQNSQVSHASDFNHAPLSSSPLHWGLKSHCMWEEPSQPCCIHAYRSTLYIPIGGKCRCRTRHDLQDHRTQARKCRREIHSGFETNILKKQLFGRSFPVPVSVLFRLRSTLFLDRCQRSSDFISENYINVRG